MAAMNTLECILTVLNSCQERPDLFVGLESKLLPMLHRLLHPSGDGIEVCEKKNCLFPLCCVFSLSRSLSLSHARKRGAGEEAAVSFLHRSSHSHPPPTLASPSPPLPSSPFLLISSATTTAAPRERVPNSRLAHVHDTTAALFPTMDSF